MAVEVVRFGRSTLIIGLRWREAPGASLKEQLKLATASITSEKPKSFVIVPSVNRTSFGVSSTVTRAANSAAAEFALSPKTKDLRAIVLCELPEGRWWMCASNSGVIDTVSDVSLSLSELQHHLQRSFNDTMAVQQEAKFRVFVVGNVGILQGAGIYLSGDHELFSPVRFDQDECIFGDLNHPVRAISWDDLVQGVRKRSAKMASSSGDGKKRAAFYGVMAFILISGYLYNKNQQALKAAAEKQLSGEMPEPEASIVREKRTLAAVEKAVLKFADSPPPSVVLQQCLGALGHGARVSGGGWRYADGSCVKGKTAIRYSRGAGSPGTFRDLAAVIRAEGMGSLTPGNTSNEAIWNIPQTTANRRFSFPAVGRGLDDLSEYLGRAPSRTEVLASVVSNIQRPLEALGGTFVIGQSEPIPLLIEKPLRNPKTPAPTEPVAAMYLPKFINFELRTPTANILRTVFTSDTDTWWFLTLESVSLRFTGASFEYVVKFRCLVES